MNLTLYRAAVDASYVRAYLEHEVAQQASVHEGRAWLDDIAALKRARQRERDAWLLLDEHDRGDWRWGS